MRDLPEPREPVSQQVVPGQKVKKIVKTIEYKAIPTQYKVSMFLIQSITYIIFTKDSFLFRSCVQ